MVDSVKLEKFEQGDYVSVQTSLDTFDAKVEEIILPTESDTRASIILRDVKTNNIKKYDSKEIIEIKKHHIFKPDGAVIS